VTTGPSHAGMTLAKCSMTLDKVPIGSHGTQLSYIANRNVYRPGTTSYSA